jgi:hypothetical protein
MIINRPHLCTKISIWYPKYVTASGDYEAWISKFKVRYASPVIIVEFIKAKHLQGQRFAVRRYDVERSPIGSNGRIPVYMVPFGKLEPYETPADVQNTVNQLFKEDV